MAPLDVARRLAAAGLALFAAACEDAPRVVKTYNRGPDMDSYLASANQGGPIWVHLLGNPFAGPDEDTHRAIADKMGRSVSWRPATFTPYRDRAARTDIRVLMILGATGRSGAKLCGGALPEPPRDTTSPRIRVRALFCVEDTLWTDVEGSVKRVAAPTDPPFQDLIHQVAIRVLRNVER